MTSQLTELITNEMLATMLPNLHKLASIGLTIPVSTASVERSFSQMKFIKTRLRNRITECGLSGLMRIAIESPKTLTEQDVEVQIDANCAFHGYIDFCFGSKFDNAHESVEVTRANSTTVLVTDMSVLESKTETYLSSFYSNSQIQGFVETLAIASASRQE